MAAIIIVVVKEEDDTIGELPAFDCYQKIQTCRLCQNYAFTRSPVCIIPQLVFMPNLCEQSICAWYCKKSRGENFEMEIKTL
jgi:hypothetical protein